MRSFHSKRLRRACGWLGAFCFLVGILPARSEQPPVTLQVEVVARTGPGTTTVRSSKDASNVVVWITPDDRAVQFPATGISATQAPPLVMRNKTFEPHMLVVLVGSVVSFPNKDPFFHNVFSLFDGKRFDLGLYEAGSTRLAHFDRPGVSFLFCNIHPEMSAVIVAVESPYFGVSDRFGRVTIPNVPNGRYRLHVWYERGVVEEMKNLNRNVAISESGRSLDPIRITENPNFTFAHKNKYGQDYVPPPAPGYIRP